MAGYITQMRTNDKINGNISGKRDSVVTESMDININGDVDCSRQQDKWQDRLQYIAGYIAMQIKGNGRIDSGVNSNKWQCRLW